MYSSVHRPLPLEPSRRLYQRPWSAVRCALKFAQIQDHRSETERLMYLRRDWLIPRMLQAIESHDIAFVTFASSADVRTTTWRIEDIRSSSWTPDHCMAYTGQQLATLYNQKRVMDSPRN